MSHRLVTTVAAFAAALVVLTACSAPASETESSEWKPEPVKWSDCAKDDEAVSSVPEVVCATLVVPIEYADPKAGTTEIALAKLPATEKTDDAEAVLLNPGGPGAGGRALATLGTATLTDLATDHDLIGFDPRGTGASKPLACLYEARTMTGFEATENELAAAMAGQKEDLDACIETDREYIGSMNVETTARDMDAIRMALGEKKIDYVGFSWGTYLGATYRSLFPDSVDEMVLDSSVASELDLAVFQPDVAELGAPALQEFASFVASSPEGAPLGTTADEVAATLNELTTTLLGKQVTVDDAPVGSATLSDLVFAPKLVWADSVTQLVAIKEALGTLAPVEPGTDAVTLGIEAAYLCNDWQTAEQSASSAWKDISQLRADFPTTWTATQAYYYGFCAGWPKDLRVGDGVELRDTGSPVLLGMHTSELVTPAALTKELQGTIGGSILTIEDDIHASAGTGSRCGAEAIAAFLSEKKLATTTCEYDLDPFGEGE